MTPIRTLLWRVGFAAALVTTAPVDAASCSWQYANPLPHGLGIRALDHSPTLGTYVAVGELGLLQTSADGSSWTHRRLPTSEHMNSVVWTGSEFVAVGNAGTVLSSANGISWSAETSGTSEDLLEVASNGATVVAVGRSGVIRTSSGNGSWGSAASGTSLDLEGVHWSSIEGGLFVAVGENGIIRESVDGATWSPATSPTSSTLLAVTGSADHLLAGGHGGALITRTSGGAWTSLPPTPATNTSPGGGGSQIIGMTWTGTEFWVVGYGGMIVEITPAQLATPPASWTYAAPSNVRLFDIVAGPEGLFTGGDADVVFRSTDDGGTWVRQSSVGETEDLDDIAYANGLFVTVGTRSEIMTSPDGVTWTRRIPTGLPGERRFWSVTYAPPLGAWVVTGSNGSVVRSTDGVSWAYQHTGLGGQFSSVIWDGGQFVAVDYDRRVLTSSNGLAGTWIATDTGLTSGNLYDLAYSPELDLYVAVGDSGQIVTSSDAVGWDERSTPTSATLRGIAWSGSSFLAVGQDGAALTSPDGITWTARTTPTTNWLYGPRWDGTRFVVAGHHGTILTSVDGISWNQEPVVYGQALLDIVKGADGRWVAAGDWGAILIGNPGAIFCDGFESGGAGSWSAAVP